jgi:hypothetical protein
VFTIHRLAVFTIHRLAVFTIHRLAVFTIHRLAVFTIHRLAGKFTVRGNLKGSKKRSFTLPLKLKNFFSSRF